MMNDYDDDGSDGDEKDYDFNDEDGEDLRDFERGSVKYIKTNITTIYVTYQCTRGDRVEDKHSIRIKSCIACKPSRASLTVIFIYFLRYEIEKKLRAVYANPTFGRWLLSTRPIFAGLFNVPFHLSHLQNKYLLRNICIRGAPHHM